MEKVFLDANVVIDLVEKRRHKTIDDLDGYELFISPISVHILIYVTKQKIPYSKLSQVMLKFFTIVPFDQTISISSLEGPTSDFEDNVQLHSAAQTECNFFLTEDRKLLDLRFFGKTQIATSIATS